jgi:type I restriction enzyme R subunit
MTATPSLRDGADNTEYFGDPVYEYTLKQGIADGYLAPYKVLRITLDKDLGWRPEAGQRDESGEEIEDREYNQQDMNRTLVLRERDIVTARRITRWLTENGRFSRTIVFCEDIDHAGRMRLALANENADLCAQNPKYVMKITGDDAEGKAELDNFIDSEKTYPVIACTSRLMTTGVDAKMCRLVVLDRTINSMTEFKQIIGRGTRIEEDYGKLFFTIMDFKQATKLFADPAFDGEAAEEKEEKLGGEDSPEGGDASAGPDGAGADSGGAGDGNGADGDGADGRGGAALDELDPDKVWDDLSGGGQEPPGGDGDAPGKRRKERRKFYVGGVEVRLIDELVQSLDASGKLMTESIFDFSKRNILKYYPVRSAFVEKWRDAERKRLVLAEMEDAGVLIEDLQAKYGTEADPFDLICHVAYGARVLTRRERAEKAVRDLKLRDAHSRYGEKAKLVIERLLDKYRDGGLESLEDPGILKVPPFPELGSVVEIYRSLGGKDGYDRVIRDLESALYDRPDIA